jgi:hypothetical protein
MHTPALALHRLALACMARKYTPALAFDRLALVCTLALVALVASLVGGPRAKWYSPALDLALVCMCALVLALGHHILPPPTLALSPNAVTTVPGLGVALVVQQHPALLANACHSTQAPAWCC